jgi:hypothetical protein
MKTTEIIIKDNGTIMERSICERDLNAGQLVRDALNEAVTRTVRNILSLPGWGLVHANAGSADTLWSVAIGQIPLHARFRLVAGVLVPAFVSDTEIEMPVVWQPPPEVRLAFVVLTQPDQDRVKVAGNWLFACDQDNRGFRLPLPNLHDDCRICTGDFEACYDTVNQAVLASLEQFRKSKWNADLMRTVERSQKFFRFQPTDESFQTLPIEAADWRSLCDKVSTDIMERVVL